MCVCINMCVCLYVCVCIYIYVDGRTKGGPEGGRHLAAPEDGRRGQGDRGAG